jgi:ATPase subunit of ABC transporter with duplicated ATPase domains
MEPTVVELNNVTLQYGSQVLFLGANLKINPGEKVGLVGPNGAGKTTIFRLLLGEEKPDEGNVERPKRLSGRRVPPRLRRVRRQERARRDGGRGPGPSPRSLVSLRS